MNESCQTYEWVRGTSDFIMERVYHGPMNVSYVWDNSFICFICVTWRIHKFPMCTWVIHMYYTCDMTHSYVSYAWYDAFICFICVRWRIHMLHIYTWLIHMFHTCFICMTRLIHVFHMREMTHLYISYVWDDTFICSICVHSYVSHVWDDSSMCVTWLIHMFHICTWLIHMFHMCVTTHSCVSYVWHNSFICFISVHDLFICFTCVTWLIHVDEAFLFVVLATSQCCKFLGGQSTPPFYRRLQFEMQTQSIFGFIWCLPLWCRVATTSRLLTIIGLFCRI